MKTEYRRETKFMSVVKQYLEQVWYLEEEIKAIDEQLAHLDSIIGRVTVVMTDMPHSPNKVNSKEIALTDAIDLKKDRAAKMEQLIKLHKEISTLIDEVPTREHRCLLTMRYLNHRSWLFIADKLGVTERHVYRLHKSALKETENVIKKMQK